MAGQSYKQGVTSSRGLKIISQDPADIRLIFDSEADIYQMDTSLQNTIKQNAYVYYDGTIVRTIDTHEEYAWKKEPDQTETVPGILDNPTGILPSAFKYKTFPPNSYSGIWYNFFKLSELDVSKLKAVFTLLQPVDLSSTIFNFQNSSSLDYSVSGDTTLVLGATAAEFESNSIEVYLNGTLLDKESQFKQVEYVNYLSFRIKIPIINNDTNSV